MAVSRWRKWNRLIHRDLGYLCAGLTVIYAVSGLAVNHIHDWNPNYRVRNDTVQVGEVVGNAALSPELVTRVLDQLGVDETPRGTFQPDPGTLEIFLDEGAVTVDLASGVAVVEEVRERPLLRRANFLHLNEPRGIWTWLADLFAVSLALLAITGLFMIRGRKGITGRGAWLTAAGVALPLVVLWFLF